MFKDLKEKVKSISEIAGMISIVGTIVVIITATLYNFGFFSYYSTYIWDLPISISEILKDTTILLPKLLLALVVSLIVFFIIIFLLFFLMFILSKIKKNKITNNKEHSILKLKYFLSLIFFFIAFLYIILPLFTNEFIYNPLFVFSVACIIFMLDYKQNIRTIWQTILVVVIFYMLTSISIGIYDAKNMDSNVYEDVITMKNGDVFDNLKILRVYNNGIITMKEKNIIFFYSSNIKNYYVRSKDETLKNMIWR